MRRPALLLTLALLGQPLHAAELPSFLQAGEALCTREFDFDDLVLHGHPRPGSAIETCVTIDRPTRVAVLSGQAQRKTIVRVNGGPYHYEIGWTNGTLPIAR